MGDTMSPFRLPGLITPGQRTSMGVRKDSSYIQRLSNQPCSPKIESLVRAVNHDGVLVQARFLEVAEHPSDPVVHRGDAAQIVLHVALVFPTDQVLARQVGLRARASFFGS